MKTSKDTIVKFRVTAQDKKDIEEKAKANGQTISNYLRLVALKYEEVQVCQN